MLMAEEEDDHDGSTTDEFNTAEFGELVKNV